MSELELDPIIRAVQAKLGVRADGDAKILTWRAIHRAIVGEPLPAVGIHAPVSERSEKVIATLLPEVQPYARALVHAAKEEGITIHVTSGLRTIEEQNALYEKGRSKPGPVVTNVRGGFSVHNYGCAFDVTVFNGAQPVWESPSYDKVGELGQRLGLSWGGTWSNPDQPHFALRPRWAVGLSEKDFTTELRVRHNTGQPIFFA